MPSAKAVSVDIATPQPCAPGPPRLKREVDQHRHRHPAEPGEHRQRDAPSLSQLAHVELAARLEADHEEEQRHQALVDPVAQILGDRRSGRAVTESSVVQNDRYDELTAFAQTSAAIVAASSTIELPASARRYARTGAALVRAQAVLPERAPAPRVSFARSFNAREP